MKALCRIGLGAILAAAVGFAVAGGGEHAEMAYDCNVCMAADADMAKMHSTVKMDIVAVEQGAILVATGGETDAREIQGHCARFMANLKTEWAKPAAERKLCPFCTSLAKLQEIGITVEHLPSRFGEVDLLTATTDEQKEAIQKFVTMSKEMFSAHHGEGA